MAASNRKARRAQAQEKAKSTSTSADVNVSRPSRAPPVGRTLIDIAAERQLLCHNSSSLPIDPSVVTTTINPDGSLSGSSEAWKTDLDNESDSEATPYLDIFLYTSTLVCLNFTLTFLVHYQYGPAPPKALPLFLSSTVFSPTPVIILALVAVLHHRSAQPLIQVLFAGMFVFAGSWLVQATNREPYLAVMKKAPPLGTLWVWATVEMRWEWAAVCLGLVGAWGWWNGYTVL